MAEHTGEDDSPVERWWPPLPITAKHRLLAVIDSTDEDDDDADVPGDVVLDHEIVEAIADIVGSAAPVRLTWRERQFIRTQIEPVD